MLTAPAVKSDTPIMLDTLRKFRDESYATPPPEAAFAEADARPTRIFVGIPTTGRPTILPDTVRALAKQTRLPDALILSIASLDDLGDLAPEHLPFEVEIIIGKKGAAGQRNRMLTLLDKRDVLLLLDDDFLMEPDYIENTLRLFRQEDDVVVATGTVLADGIIGPGYDHEEGARRLEALSQAPRSDAVNPIYAGYGCNMAFRVETALANDIRFDENLPLYSWLEDVDFSRRLAAHGRVVKAGALRGVHLGTKTGRTPGIFLGYSQIANPVYLVRKGTMTRRHACELVLRSMASNTLRAFKRAGVNDYRGRLRGNLVAVKDVLRGQDSPGRITELRP
jgi:GT2 family glycosyltransferase